jgi:hypothetical protein
MNRLSIENQNRYKKRFVKVKRIIDNYNFEIFNDIELNEIDKTNLFIYGKKINDFHKLDYNSLYTLNIKANQEIYNMINKNYVYEGSENLGLLINGKGIFSKKEMIYEGTWLNGRVERVTIYGEDKNEIFKKYIQLNENTKKESDPRKIGLNLISNLFLSIYKITKIQLQPEEPQTIISKLKFQISQQKDHD